MRRIMSVWAAQSRRSSLHTAAGGAGEEALQAGEIASRCRCSEICSLLSFRTTPKATPRLGAAAHAQQRQRGVQQHPLRMCGRPRTCRDVGLTGGARRRQVPQWVIRIQRLKVRQRAAHLRGRQGRRRVREGGDAAVQLMAAARLGSRPWHTFSRPARPTLANTLQHGTWHSPLPQLQPAGPAPPPLSAPPPAGRGWGPPGRAPHPCAAPAASPAPAGCACGRQG